MEPDWRTAIEEAFSVEKDILSDTRRLIVSLYQCRVGELADHLNSEFRGLAFAAAGCEALHKIILVRIEKRQPTDYERRLSYPLYTDAILAAFNARKFIESSEMQSTVGSETVARMLVVFDEHLPQTVEASHAIRHNHDRALGRVRGKNIADRRQFIAVWGSRIKVTDHQLRDFWYEFSTISVRKLVCSLAAILDAR